MGKIILEDIEVYAFHGVMPEENKTGTRFVVNLELEVDLTKASQTDNLEDTFDYQKAYDIVNEEINNQYKLLEYLGGRIIRRMLSVSEKIDTVRVKVSKTNPPFGGKVSAVSIELEEKRKK